ncbi:MAG: glycine cleavage system protein GcvH [Candidatus Aminicenantes bacterium]|nr:glycine cleavage system protein GcvH [Candidatus Aminicenantes bacterium]
MYPQNRRFTKDHEWVMAEGDIATVGITEFAQKQLGDVVYVELPAVGAVLAVHQTVGTIESVKAVSEVFSPVGGEVTAANGDLANAPELLNQDPHGKGWIYKLKLSARGDLDSLMTAAEYDTYLAGLEH